MCKDFVAKESSMEYTGVVIECLSNDQFSVKLDENQQIICAYLAGRMRKNFIRVLPGDQVMIEMTRYDTKGRICHRGPRKKPTS